MGASLPESAAAMQWNPFSLSPSARLSASPAYVNAPNARLSIVTPALNWQAAGAQASLPFPAGVSYVELTAFSSGDYCLGVAAPGAPYTGDYNRATHWGLPLALGSGVMLVDGNNTYGAFFGGAGFASSTQNGNVLYENGRSPAYAPTFFPTAFAITAGDTVGIVVEGTLGLFWIQAWSPLGVPRANGWNNAGGSTPTIGNALGFGKSTTGTLTGTAPPYYLTAVWWNYLQNAPGTRVLFDIVPPAYFQYQPPNIPAAPSDPGPVLQIQSALNLQCVPCTPVYIDGKGWAGRNVV